MLRPAFTFLYCILTLLGSACSHRPPSGDAATVTATTAQIQNLNQASRAQKNLKQSLVRLRVTNAQGIDSIGTGFFFKNRNLLVTALHTFEQHTCVQEGVCDFSLGIVENSTTLKEITISAKIALRDPTSDLLFLEIKDSAALAQIVPLQKSTSTSDQITAVGFYQDSPALTFSHGNLKSRAEHETVTTIIVSQGFSGAPVVNSQGEVVGVVSSYHPLEANKDIGIARFVDVK
jgi:S1-C subfamily serine protease